MSSLLNRIKSAKARITRRAYIKRRSQSTGLFESNWFEITTYIKRWGSISTSIDSSSVGRFRFSGNKLTVENIDGRFNDEFDYSSFWYGYASQQRTLLKIEAGFIHQTQSSDLTWTQTTYPTDPTIFIGIIQGDNLVSDKNEVILDVKPLNQIFRDFPARLLTNYDDSMTASKFMTNLRDQTDGSNNYIFRPFFGDTTTYWTINTTTALYPSLNTSTAKDVIDKNTWEIMEKLAEAENYVLYINNAGKFQFTSKSANTTASQFSFYGRGKFDTTYGHTIKKINSYGFKQSNFYSGVQIKFNSADTSTSYAFTQTALLVSARNSAWNFGHRIFDIENLWMSQATAEALASSLFTDLSGLKREIDFTTSLVPHLNILDRIDISYDASTRANTENLWDINNWADTASGAVYQDELFWDNSFGDAIRLSNKEFKLLDININLDNLECKFLAREV